MTHDELLTKLNKEDFVMSEIKSAFKTLSAIVESHEIGYGFISCNKDRNSCEIDSFGKCIVAHFGMKCKKCETEYPCKEIQLIEKGLW